MNPPEKISPVEQNKIDSRFLRGTLKESLSADTTHFTKNETLLLKFHGTYEQDDRDKRQELIKSGQEPAYSMMIRTKIPGGVLTAEQYLVHDDLSEKYGNQTLRITTRQGFQFHGVLKKNMKEVIRSVNQALVTTSGACGDIVRNVMAWPAPSFEPWQAEVHKYAVAVSDLFLSQSGAYHEIWLDGEKVEYAQEPEKAEPIYGAAYLPRKFKIGMSGVWDNAVDVYTHDLGIIPEVEGDKLTGFNILVGGGFGTNHANKKTYPRLASPLCFVKPADLLEISKAVVLTQRDFGDRQDRKHARLKYTIDTMGLAKFREEVEKRFGKKTEDAHPVKLSKIDFCHGWRRQLQGTWCYGLFVENGRVKDEGDFRLKSAMREICREFKPMVYLTPAQDMMLGGLDESQKAAFEAVLKKYGVQPVENFSAMRKSSMACPALPTCGLAISESERILPSVMTELEKALEETGLKETPIIVRMTGCPNGCARPYNAEIAFVGKTAGTHNVYVGGNHVGSRLVYMLAEKVDASQLASTLKPLFAEYKKSRMSGEAFGDFCDRIGPEKARAVTGTVVTEKETWAVRG